MERYTFQSRRPQDLYFKTYTEFKILQNVELFD